MAGVHGAYLRIDLDRGTQERVGIPEAVAHRYLGGVGLGAWLLFREAPAGVDPLAPEAPLVFSFSPLVGTPLTTSAKFAVVAKSPLTGFLCDALSSSHFAIAGKALGVDALVFRGVCTSPSIWFGEGVSTEAGWAGSLEPTELWGASAKSVGETLAGRGRVAAIGVAGERGVRFATISNDGRHAGRGGLGTVMGAKRLKAVVVRGKAATPLAQPHAVRRLARELAQRSGGEATAKYRELGTAANLLAFERVVSLPTRNFQGGHFAAAEALSAEGLHSGRARERASCAACTIGCEHRYRRGDTSVRVEYESLFALGPLCGVGDPDIVLAASARCDELGLDTVSTGGTIAFAMECRERGLLPDAPAFGDGPGLLAVLDDIAERRGVGALLAEGSRRAAATLGGEAPALEGHVKGLELPGYEPRALPAMALGLAVGTRGADHNRSSAYEADFRADAPRSAAAVAAGAVAAEDRAALLDSLILCKFLRGVFGDLELETAELLDAVTGWGLGPAELRAAARRIVALRKEYNIREGWKREDDTLPQRLLDTPLPDGASAGARLRPEFLESMIRAYYSERGWSEGGVPPRQSQRPHITHALERDGSGRSE